MHGKMTKTEVRRRFPALLAAWRALPENSRIEEQALRFSDFFSWLKEHHPAATKFRSVMGAEEDLEQWFDFATHQGWRN